MVVDVVLVMDPVWVDFEFGCSTIQWGSGLAQYLAAKEILKILVNKTQPMTNTTTL